MGAILTLWFSQRFSCGDSNKHKANENLAFTVAAWLLFFFPSWVLVLSSDFILLPTSFHFPSQSPLKIHPKSRPWGFLEGLPGRLEGIPGLLGSRKALETASGGVLDASWGCLGGVLGGQEAVLGVSGKHFGGFWGYPRTSTCFFWRQNIAFYLACRFLIEF